MIQFLNNLWITLNSQNEDLVNLLLIPLGIVESYLFMNLILIIFKVKISRHSKSVCTLCIAISGLFTLSFVPSPYNVILNYAFILLFIKIFFKLNILKSFVAFLFSEFIFGILNMLCQNTYLTLLNITFDTFMYTPLYRITYLSVLYLILYLLSIGLKKFLNTDFNLDFFDTIDASTLKILCINLIVGFLTLCIQLVVTTYYIDIVPLGINLLNFILLISFLILSICSFSRMLKLVTTEQQLACAEEYNKSLKILYDKVNGFKHDFDNMISFLDGYIQDNDMDDLKEYFTEMKKDCKITNSLSLLNPNIINNPGIYSLLNNEYFKATKLGITFNIEISLNINSLEINTYIFSRILGVLIDNAIEAAEKCDTKKVKVSFIRENINSRAIIIIKNTYSNKDVDIEKIFKKGISNKENHSGIGLWEVNKYVKKSLNLELKSSKDSNYFKQELFIYDL